MDSDSEEDLLLTAAAAAAIIIAGNARRMRRPRRFWVRPTLQSRAQCCGSNLLEDLHSDDVDPLNLEYRSYFQMYLRLLPQDFEFLLETIALKIKKQDTNYRRAIPVQERLSVTLRFLATGDNLETLATVFKISKQSISKIIPEVCKAIVEELAEYVKFPKSIDDWLEVAEVYGSTWNVPNCVGAMDGKHICIQAPPGSASDFNYKKFFSIVLFAVVDGNYNFIYVNVGAQGRISDGFKQTSFRRLMDDMKLNLPCHRPLPGREKAIPFVFLGDDAFPLLPNLMKPYSGNQEKGSPTRVCNYRISRGRRVSENVFGILSSFFHCLRKPLLMQPETAELITLAIVHLHNFMRSRPSVDHYNPANMFDVETTNGTIQPGSWRSDGGPTLPDLPRVVQRSALEAMAIRDEFKEYFVSEQGAVSWQMDYC